MARNNPGHRVVRNDHPTRTVTHKLGSPDYPAKRRSSPATVYPTMRVSSGTCIAAARPSGKATAKRR
jgi:hypothetical protein